MPKKTTLRAKESHDTNHVIISKPVDTLKHALSKCFHKSIGYEILV